MTSKPRLSIAAGVAAGVADGTYNLPSLHHRERSLRKLARP